MPLFAGPFDLAKLEQQYKAELLDNVVPFWLNKSQDKEHGGYFTCLDRRGDVFDTDKFIWLQGRQVWCFSMLYNKVEKRQEWLECAIQGADFLKKYGHDGNYNWYFALEADGTPLVDPYNIFSFTFAAMAFGQLSLATGSEEYANIAKTTFDIIMRRRNNPKDRWSKAHAGGKRSLKNFALPMILCNLALELEHLLSPELLNETIDICLKEVMGVFLRPELGGIVIENVNSDNTLSDSFDGRLVNPGHAIEAMWFVMDLGVRRGDNALIQKAVDTCLTMIKYGWDSADEERVKAAGGEAGKYGAPQGGGILYFMDRKGAPPQQLEWDQKLWWVHIETLIALLKGYRLTGRAECLEWFAKIHAYTWQHFKDEENPEWYGYLRRDGDVLLPLKGGKWKGCFHVPRGLFQCWQILKDINNNGTKQ